MLVCIFDQPCNGRWGVFKRLCMVGNISFQLLYIKSFGFKDLSQWGW